MRRNTHFQFSARRAVRSSDGAVPALRTQSAREDRPGWYRPEFDETAHKLCLLGHTNADLARHFGCGESSLNRWIATKPTFKAAVISGRDVADAEIAASLYHRAKGYSHPAVKIMSVAQGQGMASVVERHDYVEHYPPDTAAASLWLRNRQGAKWRDKTDVEHSGSVTLEALILASMNDKTAAPAVQQGPSDVIEGTARVIEEAP